MYRLTSPEKISIVTHVCNTLELAEIVKNYIESRHNCSIKIEEHPGKMYYDCPGMRLINPELYDVEIPFMRSGLQDISILADIIEHLEHDPVRGFSRIASFRENICLSEAELAECKQFVTANQKLIDNWGSAFDAIMQNHFKRLKDKNERI